MPEVTKEKAAARKKSTHLSEGSDAFQFMARDNGVASLIFDMKSKKVNTLTPAVMEELSSFLDHLAGDSSIKVLIFSSGKEDNFVAGVDISEIRDIHDPKEATEKARTGQMVFQKINDMPFPVIAAIQGACVGGGLELALACHFRIAKSHAKTRIGLPEVKIGILPGFGGTQRLPRLIGIQRALGLILTGKLVNARIAGNLGIVDKVLPEDSPFSFLQESAEQFALNILQGYRRSALEDKRKIRKFSAFFLESNRIGKKFLFEQARKRLLKTTRGHYPAPMKAIESVELGIELSLRDGLEIEATLLGELVATEVSKNLISLYYLNEAVKKDPGVDAPKSEPREIAQVGLLGAGVMGGGIAQYLAFKELPVRMKDINQEAVQLGLRKAKQLFQQATNRKKLSPREMSRKMSLISGTTDYSGFSQADFVIEAVVENLEVKRTVMAEVEAEIRSTAILASNTSSLSITEIASDVKYPERIIGFHFFNPVHRMPLVEIIRGDKTSDETTVSAVAFAKKIGKVPIVVNNSPGFLVNRVLGPYLNEATILLEDGLSIKEIDESMLEFGMPMGPLNLLDEIGIDVGLKVSQILHAAFRDRIEPSRVIERLHSDGRLGKKSGRGFYSYEGKKKQVDTKVEELISDLRKPGKEEPRDDVQNRLVFTMLKEAVLCLQEGVVRKAEDIDVGMIFGTGFPPFRGGLLRYADSLGQKTCLVAMNVLAKKYGPRFTPPRLLIEMVEDNMSFYH